MNNYIIIIIIIIIILQIYYIHKISFILNDVNQPIPSQFDTYITPNISLKYSKKIKDRGVFANKNYKKNEILEICPTVTVPFKISKPLQSYVFEYDENYNLFPLGYCGMYNHSDTPNVLWNITDNLSIKLSVIKDININEEIYINYGNEYWKIIGIDKH
jgi:hypothetical protein